MLPTAPLWISDSCKWLNRHSITECKGNFLLFVFLAQEGQVFGRNKTVILRQLSVVLLTGETAVWPLPERDAKTGMSDTEVCSLPCAPDRAGRHPASSVGFMSCTSRESNAKTDAVRILATMEGPKSHYCI